MTSNITFCQTAGWMPMTLSSTFI